MESLIYILGWGTPIGIGLFLFLMASSAAILIQAIANASNSKKNK